MQTQRNQFLILGSIALGLIGGYYAYTRLAHTAGQPKLRRQVARRLPVSKRLSTIEDTTGNYDMDGVSFDTEGVVVSGDNNKGLYV